MAKRLTDAERDYVVANYSQLGATEVARRVGCSRSTAQRVWSSRGGPREVPHNSAPSAPAEAAGPSTLGRLVELRGMLRAAMNDAPAAAMAGLSREYRAVIEEIERMEGGDRDDPTGKALDAIAERIAAKMPPA